MQGYWDVVILSFIGFVILAAILLVPVWRFLSREEEAADRFNQDLDQSDDGESAP